MTRLIVLGHFFISFILESGLCFFLPLGSINSVYDYCSRKSLFYFLLQIKLRGFLSHTQQLRVAYWGITSIKAQSTSSLGLPSPRSKDAADENQPPTEASGVGRNWVQSMFSRDTASKSNSFSRVRRWGADAGGSGTSSVNIIRFDLTPIVFPFQLIQLHQHGFLSFDFSRK